MTWSQLTIISRLKVAPVYLNMNSLDIERMILTGGGSQMFLGVKPRDEVRHVVGQTGVLVFNTDKRNEPGTHWIGLVLTPTRVEYFDSYGLPPHSFPDVYRELVRSKRAIIWSNTQLQGLTSTVCGDYCVLFLLLRIRGVSLEDFVLWMDQIPTAERRDHIIRRTILTCFGDLYTPNPRLKGIDGVHITLE